MNNRITLNLVLIVLFFCMSILVSCHKQPPIERHAYTDINHASTDVARILTQSINDNLIINQPIIVASFVNINNLEESSTFGRVMSEQIAARLTQNGFKIIELKLRNNSIFMKEGTGELLLSRELKKLSKTQKAYAALVGTYAATEDLIFITAKIIITDNNSIIAAHNFQLYSNSTIAELLTQRK